MNDDKSIVAYAAASIALALTGVYGDRIGFAGRAAVSHVRTHLPWATPRAPSSRNGRTFSIKLGSLVWLTSHARPARRSKVSLERSLPFREEGDGPRRAGKVGPIGIIPACPMKPKSTMRSAAMGRFLSWWNSFTAASKPDTAVAQSLPNRSDTRHGAPGVVSDPAVRGPFVFLDASARRGSSSPADAPRAVRRHRKDARFVGSPHARCNCRGSRIRVRMRRLWPNTSKAPQPS